MSESARLIQALREDGVDIPRDLDFDSVVKKLKTMSLVMPEIYKKDALNYLDKNADSLIHIASSKPGILSWHFEEFLSLR